MQEDISIINNETRKEKIINLFKENKKKNNFVINNFNIDSYNIFFTPNLLKKGQGKPCK